MQHVRGYMNLWMNPGNKRIQVIVLDVTLLSLSLRDSLQNSVISQTFSKEDSARGHCKIFLREITKRTNKCGFNSRHLRANIRVRSCEIMSFRVQTYVRGREEGGLDGQEGKSDGRTKRSKRTRAREMEREREERIQYNCTHVYRVDGNILERILKYLLVV